MKIFEMKNTSEHNESIYIEKDYENILNNGFRGIEMSLMWPKEVHVITVNDGIKSDALYFSPGVPVISEKAKRFFKPYLKNEVEFLPLKHPEHGNMYAINVLNVLKDSIDFDASEIERFSSGEIKRINKFAFKSSVVKENLIFKINEFLHIR